jgi:hypothetical protein
VQVKGQRHARPKAVASDAKNRNVPAFSLWGGQRLSYIEARKAIYVPLYRKLATATPEFAELKAMIDKGTNVQIIGYDGYSIEMTRERMLEALNDGSRPFGHELVLAAMLAGIDLDDT